MENSDECRRACKRAPVLILAAGGSRRMGRPKGLLSFRGEILLDHSLALAKCLGGPVTVVTGAGYPLLRYRSRRQPARWLQVKNWSQGLSASLRAGLASLGADVNGCFVLLMDQPLLDRNGLERLAASAQLTPWHPVAADYDGRPGTPAYLPRWLWPEIMALEGDRGAGAVLARAGAERIVVAGVEQDVDTPDDWQRLRASGEQA